MLKCYIIAYMDEFILNNECYAAKIQNLLTNADLRSFYA